MENIGGGEESAEEAAESYNRAFADGDLEKFCSYLGPRAEQDYADAIGAATSDCNVWAPQLYDATGSTTLETIGNVTARELNRKIDGNTVVRTSDGELLLMAKRDGEWKILLTHF